MHIYRPTNNPRSNINYFGAPHTHADTDTIHNALCTIKCTLKYNHKFE